MTTFRSDARSSTTRVVGGSHAASGALQIASLVFLLVPNGTAQALPSAASILDRYVEVTGGKAAYTGLTTQIFTGKITIPAANESGSFTRYLVAPDKEYEVMDTEHLGRIEGGGSDGIVWAKDQIQGPRLKSGEEQEEEHRNAYLRAPLDWRKLYTKAITTGSDEVEGEACYEVVLTPKNGHPETRCYSRGTGLLLRMSRTYIAALGEFKSEELYSDYQAFGGDVSHPLSDDYWFRAAGSDH